ncbi:MAG: ATP-binding cassette domain-containing protein [Acidimicrobiia bacterium]
MAAIIECGNLIKIHKQGSLEVVALQGLDFVMAEGEFISIVGKSGAGKSTLLQILAGLETPSAGSVTVADTDLADIGQSALVSHYRRNVGFLWQDFTRNLLPYLKAIKNVELPMLLAGMGGRKRRQRANDLLEATGLRNRAYAPVHTMSGGEQQRLALCVALALGPRLLLADEPTGELDTETSLEIYELLRTMCHDGGLSILVVTHDVALAQRTDRVVRLADGRVAIEGDLHGVTETIAVDPAGVVRLPRDLLLAAGIEEGVDVRLVDGGILLSRPEPEIAASPEPEGDGDEP